ncbi:sulfotransferase [Vibrio sp. 1075]|uniref:sulfotransferase n=1 Tax=Vibrio sp. 1075 TaxID=3074543 RepID=UPI002963E500|nr:sulfotransferase [Vibrio sp. 1075]MDW2309497.1 sulfotransferase [Vibrio sp. 1075]
MSDILKNRDKRSKEFEANLELDKIISKLSPILSYAEKREVEKFDSPKMPTVGILGCPRSGTTLISQILAESQGFYYPNNLLNRFSYAPYIGCLIDKMLTDERLMLGRESNFDSVEVKFDSDIGKTRSYSGINEFFHFWRNYLPNHDPGHLTLEELNKVDVKGLQRSLASMESISNKPFMSKAMMLQYNVEFFNNNIPSLFFLYIKRDPMYVMQSIVTSRRKFYPGDETIWWSVKPKEYDILKSLPFLQQIAGQVFFTELAIESQLKNVPEDRKLIIDYEDLCSHPEKFLQQLEVKLNQRWSGISLKNKNFKSYDVRNTKKLSDLEISKLAGYYKMFAEQEEIR